ncbi:hypothetical protein GALL_555010 [mine drainage metagenome]|uniref:Uncharacterized protein n=1 Tax=mine drainage metagenome TaxID=410659 RepID=A0A1J5P6C3_9ZZZZ
MPRDVEPQPHGICMALQQVSIRQPFKAVPEAARDDRAELRIRGELAKDAPHDIQRAAEIIVQLRDVDRGAEAVRMRDIAVKKQEERVIVGRRCRIAKECDEIEHRVARMLDLPERDVADAKISCQFAPDRFEEVPPSRQMEP